MKFAKIFGGVFLYFFPVLHFKIHGESMSPSLKNGQSVLVNKLAYLCSKPKVKDVVAAKDPRDGKILIKRVNKVKGDRYFVEGDNKEYSTDSRVFGMLEKKEILGKVIYP